MKVVHFVAHKRSGCYIYTINLAKELSRNKSIQAVIISDAGSIKIHKESLDVVASWKRNSLFTPFKLVRLVRKLQCDIVHVQFEYSTFGKPLFSHLLLLLVAGIMKLIGSRAVVTLHGVLLPLHLAKTSLLRKLIKIVLTIYYRGLGCVSDAVIVLNNLQYEVLKSYGVNKAKLIVIPHGSDVEYKVGHHKAYSDRVVIFFQGFINPNKGLLELMDAIKMLNSEGYKVVMKMLGSIPYQWRGDAKRRNYLRTVILKAATLGDLVELKLGFFTDEEIIKEALMSDIIVLPYTDNYIETSGVLHKLMGCGKPIVVSKIPRFYAELTHEVNCLMVRPTPSEIVSAIKRLINDRKLAQSIAENLKRMSHERSWKNVAKLHLDSFARIFKH